ncbi:glutathione-disulfide reductase [Sphaerotilus mobilis]|uniref:NADPH-glutathione reductase n=1 Tax=Sphaerotilus mobilis TaxID=47994 RepID=A0A4Q7LE47_9BURK|nr:glutathione-disulfide reductase [Sphaerotilus mobilis]RZS52344.1 NADPH-glutathione reductase [Sphaerotilus mobilis]
MTTASHTHDLLVIGAGSGGVAAARRAAAHGARVLIAEADRVGGTCVIRGCVPKKLMMYAAGYAQAFEEARAYGWTDVSGHFDMARWAAAKASEIDRLEAIYRRLLADSGVELALGHARLQGDGRVVIGTREVRAPRVLIATGGAPARDTLPGLAQAMTSDEVLNLRELPASLLVLGGGYIAVEFASILAGLGTAVTLAMRDTLPLRGFDADLRRRLASALSARGITLAGGQAMQAFEHGPDGVALHRADGSVLRAAAALNATGRQPNTAGLSLSEAGVALDSRGAIVVDADSRSTAPGIWAVGDVTQRVNLTPVAIAEGRAFADTEFGGRPMRVDHRQVASAVFTDPPIATVGLSEEAAVRLGPVDIYEADFRPMKTAFAGHEARTYMKLVVDGLDERVLGVHMIGADAPEIVQSLAVALSCGATKRDLDRTVAVHPTAAEEFVLMRTPARRLPHDRTAT